MKKNVAGQKVGAQMVSATDGSAFTGSVTVYVTLDAGTQAAGSVGAGACTSEGNGYHTYAPAQAETNGDLVAFTFTGTGAVPVTVQVYPNFPQTGDTYSTLALNDTAGPVPWLGIVDQGTAVTAGATSVQLRAAAAFADDTLIGSTIAVYGSTQGYWQTRVITDNALTGDTVTVDTWTVTPSGTITYKIFGTPPASATSIPAVNVTQWLGSACVPPSVAGVPEVDLTHVVGATTNVAALATNVDAVKVQTDKLTFTVANQIDANIQYVNDVALVGDGSATPWGPA